MTSSEGSLRPFVADDAARTLAWRNAPHVRRAMFDAEPITAKTHRSWLAGVIADPDRDYFVFERDGAPLGVVGITWQSRRDGRGEWSFHIGAPDAPGGSGRMMLSLALDRFFGPMGGRKMCADVLADNAASLALHDRLGFAREGLRRRHARHGGRWKDVVEFGLLRDGAAGDGPPAG